MYHICNVANLKSSLCHGFGFRISLNFVKFPNSKVSHASL